MTCWGCNRFHRWGKGSARLDVAQGSNAREAAGVIHSDMEKGFIRAEVISFEDIITYGGTAEARAKGRLRVEGKNYIVQDGDILEIRFNI